MQSFVPSVQVVDLPFLFKDAPTAAKILDGSVGQQIFADMDAKGIVGLEWGWYGWRLPRRRDALADVDTDRLQIARDL